MLVLHLRIYYYGRKEDNKKYHSVKYITCSVNTNCDLKQGQFMTICYFMRRDVNSYF